MGLARHAPQAYLEIMSNICWEPELQIKSEVKKKFKTVEQ